METAQRGGIISEDRLFALARRSKRLPDLLTLVLVTLTLLLFPGDALLRSLVDLVFPLSHTVAILITSPQALPSALGLVIALMIMEYQIPLGLWLWLKWVERRPFWTLGFERPRAMGRYLLGMLVGLTLFAAIVGVSMLFGAARVTGISGGSGSMGATALGGVALAYVGWAIQGATEEMLSRGWLLPTLGVRYSPLLAVVASSLAFALMHIFNTGVTPLALLNLTLFGSLMAAYALYEGSLWGVCGLHAAWNWAESNLFGASVSGFTLPGGQLFAIHPVGSAWLTGGRFGPEGGLPVTLVLSCAIAFTLLSARVFPRRAAQRRPIAAPAFYSLAPSQARAKKVFLSYLPEDQQVVAPLVKALRAHKVECRLAPVSEESGAIITQELVTSGCFIRVCSAAALRSSALQWKVNAFHELQMEEIRQGVGQQRIFVDLIIDSACLSAIPAGGGASSTPHSITINTVGQPQAAWLAGLLNELGALRMRPSLEENDILLLVLLGVAAALALIYWLAYRYATGAPPLFQ